MLPGSIQIQADTKLELDEVESGLYTVKNAYDGVYDFFAAPSLFDEPTAEPAAPAEAEPAPEASEAGGEPSQE